MQERDIEVYLEVIKNGVRICRKQIPAESEIGQVAPAIMINLKSREHFLEINKDAWNMSERLKEKEKQKRLEEKMLAAR